VEGQALVVEEEVMVQHKPVPLALLEGGCLSCHTFVFLFNVVVQS